MGKRVLRIAVGAAALLVSSVWAQQNVGIGTNTPHPTALLELYSTSKGLLIPRMTQAERDAISSPATGLLIYQTDNTPGFYYWNGTAWIPILSSSSGSGLFWSLTGNSITGTEFLGTTNNQPLVIRVNNTQTFQFNTNLSLQRDAGGNARGQGAVDLQSARSAATQVASGDYSVIGGGEGNTASGDLATVGGGYANTASGDLATVGGGYANTTSGDHATVGGGGKNTASGSFATVGGGYGSLASSDYATVGGGSSNTASGNYATVGGGGDNTASGKGATVGGGYQNTASGFAATVGGGEGNTASGDYSAIPGGYNLRVGTRSFGFSGQTSATQTDLSANSNIAAFVDVDLWLYSRDRTQASQLRLYEAQAHGSGANYVALRAPTSLSANTTYTLPASLTPTSTVGAGILQTDASGNLSWVSPTALATATAWALTGNSITTAWNGSSGSFLGTTNAQPLVIATTNTTTPQPIQVWVGNQETFRFNPPGASAPAWSIQRGGGNPRGLHAVDLQSARSAVTQVASGNYSVIGGGQNNTASGSWATVGGGYGSLASGDAATVGGGYGNTASLKYATVGGGESNTASGGAATVGGGSGNTASGDAATVGGGEGNTASGRSATAGGGSGNTASGDYSAIPGGYNLRVGNRSFGFSGQTSTTQTDLSTNSNIAAFVDVDLWLYSRDRTQASQLRFYEAQAHGSGANYVALRAPTSLSANTTYTLPASDGSPGQVLTTDGNGQLSWSWNSGGTIFVRKTANESVTNSTTPQADDHLYATLPANSIWEVEILLRTQSAGPDNSNGGIQVQLNAPTGTSMQVYVEIKKGGSGSDLNHHWHYGWITAPNTSVGYNPIPGTTTQTGAVKLKGLVIVGSTGGTLQLYWAQNAANGNATTVYANSYMRLTRMQ